MLKNGECFLTGIPVATEKAEQRAGLVHLREPIGRGGCDPRTKRGLQALEADQREEKKQSKQDGRMLWIVWKDPPSEPAYHIFGKFTKS